MFPRKYRVLDLNNFTDYIGTIWVENSIAIVNNEHQLREIDRHKVLGDFKFEEIIEKKETIDIVKHDVEERIGDVRKDDTIDNPIKKPGRPRNSNRSGSQKRRSNSRNK